MSFNLTSRLFGVELNILLQLFIFDKNKYFNKYI